MLEASLRQLGLSDREAGVYLLLLRSGWSTARDLIKELGWHRQLVYNALGSLQRQGLVSSSFAGTKQQFRAAPPRKILEKVRSSYELAEDLVPQLEELQSGPIQQQIVQVHHGLVGVKFVHEDILQSVKSGEIVCTLGASGPEYAVVMGDYHTEWTKKRLKKKIELRVIAFDNERRAMNDIFKDAWQFTKARYLPTSYQAPTSTKIYADKIAIQIWNPADPVIILVENPKVAQNYRQYFEFLWKLAK